MVMSICNTTPMTRMLSKRISPKFSLKFCTRSSMHTTTCSRYNRVLPSTVISLFSSDGKRLLQEAMTSETAAGFLEMSSNLVTQTELTYCGLSSLTTILNALSIDPQRVWKGAWRWYDETMLITNEPLRKKINADGLKFEDLVDVVPKDKVYLQAVFASDSSLQEFREYLRKTCSSGSSYILPNYSRPVLGQTGTGHYSPIAAYNITRDAVLIMDVARFKYPPHWVPCTALWDAMFVICPATGKTRGFMVISRP